MEYRLLTLWKIGAPCQEVYDAVFNSLQWPVWWPGVEHVEQIGTGDADGIGSLRRYTWKGRLPYCLSFVARTTEIEQLCLLAADVDSDLAGSGRWTFLHDSGITTVRYDWQVRTTRPWMNALAPLARGIFTRNHHAVMRQGGQGLARHLEVPLVDAYYGNIP